MAYKPTKSPRNRNIEFPTDSQLRSYTYRGWGIAEEWTSGIETHWLIYQPESIEGKLYNRGRLVSKRPTVQEARQYVDEHL